MNLVVAAYSVDGKKSLIIERTGSIDDPKILGRKLGLELKDRGIEELASNWREKLEEWNKK